jgi:hypothetical protein
MDDLPLAVGPATKITGFVLEIMSGDIVIYHPNWFILSMIQ